MPSRRRIIVTGAAGFVGSGLTAALLSDPANAAARIALVDTARINDQSLTHRDERVEIIEGDFGDPHVLDAATGDGTDLVYHLAAIVGPSADADYKLARRVNIDATLNLFERMREGGRCPRIVYASSIAVFGEPPPPSVDDSTVPGPTMTYGAHKHMIEIALAQFSAQGWLDGLSLRLPAIVAKPRIPGQETVFLNDIFHAFASGETLTVPVSPLGTSWLLSLKMCVAALVHAGHLASATIGRDRSLTLPAQRVVMQDLVEGLMRRYGDNGTRIDFAPVERIEAQFASQPPLSTVAADRLGFCHDGDVDGLIRNSVS